MATEKIMRTIAIKVDEDFFDRIDRRAKILGIDKTSMLRTDLQVVYYGVCHNVDSYINGLHLKNNGRQK